MTCMNKNNQISNLQMSKGFPRVQLVRMIWTGFQNTAYPNCEKKLH